MQPNQGETKTTLQKKPTIEFNNRGEIISTYEITCIQRAEQRLITSDDPRGALKQALNYAYAARSLKAVLEGDLLMLKESFHKVGKVFPEIAVACLMARHKRLGANSTMRNIPNFVIRHILSILGAPFDMLNAQIRLEHRHCTTDENEDTPNEKRQANKSSINLHYCGIEWLYHHQMCCEFIPSKDGPKPKQNESSSTVLELEEPGEWNYGMIPQLFLKDETLMNLTNFNLLRPLRLLAKGYKEDVFDYNAIQDYSRSQFPLKIHAMRCLSTCISKEVGIGRKKSDILKYVVDGDTLFHVACRLVARNVGKSKQNDDLPKSNKFIQVRDFLAALAPKLIMNAKHEMPIDWELSKNKYGRFSAGAKFTAGDTYFPSTGCYAASCDLLMEPLKYNGRIFEISMLLGKCLNEKSEIILCSCKCLNIDASEEFQKYVVTRSSKVIGIDLDPTFIESRKSLSGAYMVTDVQKGKLQPPLEVVADEYLCLINKYGSLNVTCSLGTARRRRLLPNVTNTMKWEDDELLPFKDNFVKKSCVGWNCSINILR